ncbi:TraR/DksA family transcriptional regulator [Gimesia fumaroli]|uniref:TraR/DksA family transcriptional regulator n=1 Tax=Gimesia fumaroli TaxID=2527976 RepID=UPI0018D9027D|nr:TraR/DksA family transcriptional regulator [Gimesia fumaroli]
MVRKDAIIRLHQQLLNRRDELKKLVSDSSEGSSASRSTVEDSGDAALRETRQGLESHLAEIEYKELMQIRRAISLIQEGRYGHCENCNKNIPIARLKAVPYTMFCVDCAQQRESMGLTNHDLASDWENAYEYEGRLNDQEVRIHDLDLEK